MPEPQWRLLIGDPFLCERALEKREIALQETDPETERHVLFADEVNLPALRSELQSVSLFAMSRHFVIRRGEKARKPKEFAAVLEMQLPTGTYLTMVASTMKSTSPIAKLAKASGATVSLPAPKRNAVAGLAREILMHEGVTPSQPLLRAFMERCGAELTAMEQEAKKLATVAIDGQVDVRLADAMLFNHTETTIYPFYDRVGEGNLAAALKELTAVREDAGRIVGGIIRHLTRLTMIRLLIDQRVPNQEIAGKMGMQAWLCKRLTAQARRRPLHLLTEALHTGVCMDTKIKQGRIAPLDALMQLILVATAPA